MSNVANPQCGCDNVTYWNESVANQFGANVKASGQCAAATAVKCNTGAMKCEGKRFCSFGVANLLQCGGIANPQGICWGLPPTCASPNGKYTTCPGAGGGGDNCNGLCDSIKAEKQFYFDSGCN